MLLDADFHVEVDEALVCACADSVGASPLDYPRLAFLAYHYGLLGHVYGEVCSDIEKGNIEPMLFIAKGSLESERAIIEDLFNRLGVSQMLPSFVQGSPLAE